MANLFPEPFIEKWNAGYACPACIYPYDAEKDDNVETHVIELDFYGPDRLAFYVSREVAANLYKSLGEALEKFDELEARRGVE